MFILFSYKTMSQEDFCYIKKNINDLRATQLTVYI